MKFKITLSDLHGDVNISFVGSIPLQDSSDIEG